MIFFVLKSGFEFEFNAEFIPYSIAFAVSYGMSMAGGVLAIKYGSFSLTSLIVNYSLLIPTFYGIFVYNDPVKFAGYAGFLLLCVSLFMINEKDNVKKKVTFKWILSLFVAFIGSGCCSLFQKMQQVAFSGKYKSEFMIVALVLCSVGLLVAAIIKREKNMSDLKHSLPMGILSGAANGIVNYLVMVLTATVPSAILFPSISAGSIAITFVAGIFVYKEKFINTQYIGYALGVISLVLLNL